MSELVLKTIDNVREVLLKTPERLLPLAKLAITTVCPQLGEMKKLADAWGYVQKNEVNERVAALYATVAWTPPGDQLPPVDPTKIDATIAYPVITMLLADEDRAKFWAYAALLRAFDRRQVVAQDRPRYLRAVRDFLNSDLIAYTKLKLQQKESQFLSRQDVRDNPQVVRGLERWALVGAEKPKGLEIASGFTHLQTILIEGLTALADLTGAQL